MLQQSPLKQQPEIGRQYKNEWAYLQDRQMKKQNEVADDQVRLEQEIKARYRQDLISQIGQRQQLQQSLAGNQVPAYKSSHDKYMEQQFAIREQVNNKINSDCLNFNQHLMEQKKENYVKEKEREKIEAQLRVQNAQSEEQQIANMRNEVKSFMKNEFMAANIAQEQIKKLEHEKLAERSKAYAQEEQHVLDQQHDRREKFLDNLKLRYFVEPGTKGGFSGSSGSVREIFAQNHLRQLEDKRNIEKAFVDDYNQRKRVAEEESRAKQAVQKKQTQDEVLTTLKAQIAQRQNAMSQSQLQKVQYSDFLAEKDKEGREQMQIVEEAKKNMQKQYTSMLLEQMKEKKNSEGFMDGRELNLNRSVFQEGVSASVPGMFSDYARKRQLSMINQSLGYQNRITTPQHILLYSDPKAVRNESLPLRSNSNNPNLVNGNAPSQQMIPSASQGAIMTSPQRQQQNIFAQQGRNILA